MMNLFADPDLGRWDCCSVNFHTLHHISHSTDGSSTGELEMNFGEYEFAYPDGEIDTTPTSGQSDESFWSFTSAAS